jgi:hypothetical protein
METCKRCLFTSDIAKIGEDQCEYCDLHDELESTQRPLIEDMFEEVKRNGRGKDYDCLIGVSGGFDSSVLLYIAVNVGLRPYVMHFDNGYNTEEAEYNMRRLCGKLNVKLHKFVLSGKQRIHYDWLNEAFLMAGLPDADTPNDVVMTKLMYQQADKLGIKYILNGHDYRTEGSTPKAWTYMDAKYLRSVFKKHILTNQKLDIPLFTFADQLKYAWKGIVQLRPFYSIDVKNIEQIRQWLIDEGTLVDYGGKHRENTYTEFVGYDLLPNKFGIDKRRVYLSARMRSGLITRDEAMNELKTCEPPRIKVEYGSERGDRLDYDRYNFKRWKWVIWLLAKMRVVPWTFYVKYAR